MDLKGALVTTLRNKIGLDMMEDISCYPLPDGTYQVDYWISDGIGEALGLTEKQREDMELEEGLSEYFDDPEDAVEFFLMLRESNEEETARSYLRHKPTLEKKLTGKGPEAEVEEELRLSLVT